MALRGFFVFATAAIGYTGSQLVRGGGSWGRLPDALTGVLKRTDKEFL
jgi:hypothetical protein